MPSIIYAGLALATLMKSSQLELGTAGSDQALWLRDAAQSNLEQSLNSQWIDVLLAEAALVSSSLITFVVLSDPPNLLRPVESCLQLYSFGSSTGIVRDVRLLPSATL